MGGVGGTSRSRRNQSRKRLSWRSLQNDAAWLYMLRDYQIEAIERLRNELRAGRRRVLLGAPTGAGKTTIAAEVIRSAVAKSKRVWFVAHRRELISQCSARLDSFGVEHGVIQATHSRHRPEEQVQVVSIQTIVRREGYALPDLIIVDEAHRARAESYRQVIEACPNATVLGLTATPVRQDGKPLGAGLFQSLVMVAQPRDLIERGYLLKPRIFVSAPVQGLDGVEVKRGDYDQEQLGQVMELANEAVVRAWLAKQTGRTVAFAASVKHSKTLVGTFAVNGVKAEHVDANTPKETRDAILARMRTGETQVVSNVGILTEGWDLPELECVLIARPTKSLGLYLQMAGRGMRPHPGKSDFLLLDNGGCFAEHGPPHIDREWSLEGRPKAAGSMVTTTCPKCFAVLEGRPAECPQCGASLGGESNAETKEHGVDGTMVEVDTIAHERHDELVRLYRIAEGRQYRRGWVQHRFRAKFEDEPTAQECARARRQLSKSASLSSASYPASGSGGGTLALPSKRTDGSSDSASEGRQTSAGSSAPTEPFSRSSARLRKDASPYTRNDGSQWSEHMEAVHSWFVRQTMLSSK